MLDSFAIRKQLVLQAEKEYQCFSKKLLPGTEHILGVRLPKLRILAKQIAKERGEEYLTEALSYYFEERMLHGMVLGYLELPIEKMFFWIAEFVPKIDNWSVCDSFCFGLKEIAVHRKEYWEFLQPYFGAKEPFAVRFAVVVALRFYMERDWIEQVLEVLQCIHQTDYYVEMAVAWAVSVAYALLPKTVFALIKQECFSTSVCQKAIQKICDSKKTTRLQREEIKALRKYFQK